MASKTDTTTDHETIRRWVFLYQEEKASGEDSTFFKLVRR
jgi:hypothetical protein